MANSTTSAQAAQASAAKAKAALKALKQTSHEDAAKHFFTGVLGIVAVFTLIHCEYYLPWHVGLSLGIQNFPDLLEDLWGITWISLRH